MDDLRRWWQERLPMWVAWHLPRVVVMCCTYRMLAHGTSGRWGMESPFKVRAWVLFERWYQSNESGKTGVV